jgi:anti-sigma B factor antagonist
MTNNLTTELYGDALIATLSGVIDRKTSPALAVPLIEAMDSATHVVCDLSDVTYISSTGYRLLLQAYHQALTKHGQVALVGASDEIRDTMHATGLREFFLLTGSLDEALEQVCQESYGHAGLR